jgi:two-component system cell cycle response regulator
MYLLEAFGHDVAGAREGAEGIALARQNKPDLILVDIHMPKMDGYQVLRHLRSDPDCCNISTIAVTALAMVGDREKLLSSGFDGYISKPIDPETFVSKVQDFLHQPLAREYPATSESPATPKTTETAGERRGVLLFVDNSPINLELARSMLAPQGYKILTASSVEEGLGLAQQEKPDLIVSDVHMPNRDGYCFIDLLHADADLRRIPFVFLSSSIASPHEEQKALSYGARKLLHRPIDPLTLVGELEACLRPR